jgi:hypothetical protein
VRVFCFLRSPFKLFLVCVLVCGSLAGTRRARADPSLDGTWKEGPLKEEYTVQKWLSDCGPAPVSGPSGGGESISVHQEGDELAFVGGGRVFRTNQCYDQMPTLVRETHTRDPSGKSWRTRCTTPPSDPRRAVINTLVSVSSNTHIDIVESGRYEISLNEGRCTADIKRTRSFDLAAKEGAVASAAVPVPAPASTPTPTTVATNQCSSPGDPARLEVRPSRKLLRTGDAFVFRAIVVDANGCATHTPTTWRFADGASADKGMSVDSNGKVTIASDATEGTYDLVASASGKSARVSAVVVSPSRYDDLLAASGLDDAGESQAASVAVITGESIGGTDVKAEDGSKRRRSIFLAIVAVVALGLGVVALIGARRTRRAAAIERDAQERHAERVREADERRREKLARHAAAEHAHVASLAEAAKVAAAEAADARAGTKMICPACRREYESGSLYCPQDSNRLVPFNGPHDLSMGPSGGMCPTCKRGFDPGVKVCPHDQDELVPYALYASRNTSSSPPRAKICPTCGGRFDGGAAFCGKDGTALVLLN